MDKVLKELDFNNPELYRGKRGLSTFVKKRMTMKMENKGLVEHLRRNNDKDRH